MNHPRLLLFPLLIALGCSATETHDEPNPSKVTAVEVMTLWQPEDEGYPTPLLIGGVTCTLERQADGSLAYEGITQPAKPLRFSPIEPGEYVLTLSGRDRDGVQREYSSPSFEVGQGRLVTVQVDLQIAKDVVVRQGGIEWVGDGLVNILTAPFRATARILGASSVEDDPFELEESPSGR